MVSKLVDLDGYRLAAAVRGGGGPPVVFVSGLGDDGLVWKPVLSALKVKTTLFTYGRPGLGGSDPLPPAPTRPARSYGDVADELHHLLAAAGIATPRVLVGHSIGALVIQAYAARWPADVAGLVPVDSTDAHLYLELDHADATILDGEDEATCARFDWQAGYDEIRAAEVPNVPAVVVTSRVGRWLEVREPEAYRPFSMADVDERWQRTQRDLATQLRAPQVISRVGAHYVHSDAPALVSAAIDAVVEAARSGRPVVVPDMTTTADGIWSSFAEEGSHHRRH